MATAMLQVQFQSTAPKTGVALLFPVIKLNLYAISPSIISCSWCMLTFFHIFHNIQFSFSINLWHRKILWKRQDNNMKEVPPPRIHKPDFMFILLDIRFDSLSLTVCNSVKSVITPIPIISCLFLFLSLWLTPLQMHPLQPHEENKPAKLNWWR